MINFIICDSDKNYISKINTLINEIMLSRYYDYSVKTYYEYSNDLKKIIHDDFIENKIYILDIEFKNSKSGIEIAKEIRKNDFDSLIIYFSTMDISKYIYSILNLFIFDFINKYEPEKLKTSILKAIDVIKIKNNRKKTITVRSNRLLCNINLDDIIYIMTNVERRGIIIHTKKNEIYTNMSLKDITEYLDNRFVKTHRSCYVNLDHVSIFDSLLRIIKFDNGDILDLVSGSEVKDIKNNLAKFKKQL